MEILRKMKVDTNKFYYPDLYPQDYIVLILKKEGDEFFWVRHSRMSNTSKEIKYRDKLTGSDTYDVDGYYKFPFYEEDLWTSSEE